MAGLNISIGDMRQKGTFLKNSPIANASGGQDDNYAILLTCRGRLRKLKGSKSLEDGDIVFNKDYEWICRFQSAIMIDSDTSLQIGDQLYRINDFEKVDQIPHFYRFLISQFQSFDTNLLTEGGQVIQTEDGQNIII